MLKTEYVKSKRVRNRAIDYRCAYCGGKIAAGREHEVITIKVQQRDGLMKFRTVRVHLLRDYPAGKSCEMIHDVLGEDNLDFWLHILKYDAVYVEDGIPAEKAG